VIDDAAHSRGAADSPAAAESPGAADSSAAPEHLSVGDPEVPVVVRRVGPGGTMASDNAFAVALLTLWHRVSEAGGAVGFARGVDRSAVGAAVAEVVDDLRTGRSLAVALAKDRNVIGFGVLRPGTRTKAHTGTVSSVMVDPFHQGGGLGVLLMDAVIGLAVAAGLERVVLGVRSGMGLESFYARFGFVECGRLPGWIKLGSDGDRDEILMMRTI
jgi:predicted N-acetyltransferase YhbS